MTESFHPELLSALLDGQLSPEQKAVVEAHLARHPQDAQTIDDLRNLRGQLQGLPRLSAPSNLQKSVLRHIRASELARPVLPAPRTGQSFANTAWLVACAASLIGLILVGVFYRPNRDDSPRVAQTPTPKSIEEQQESAARQPSNSNRDVALVLEADIAKDERANESDSRADNLIRPSGDQPTDQASNDKLGMMANSTEAKAGLAQAAPVARDSEQMPAAKELSELGGGQGGSALGGAAGAKPAPPEAQNAIPTEQSAAPMVAAKDLGELGRNDIAVESCPALDQLIVVQIPTGQSADAWIASVFQRAEVQIDVDEPESFDETMRQRKQSQARDPGDRTLDSGVNRSEADKKADADAVADSNAQDDEFLRTEVRLEASATAYMIDAEVQQIRQILNRLEGTSVVGFPSPSRPLADETLQKKTEPKAFPSNAAIARRLPSQIPPRGQLGELEKSKSIAAEARANEATQAQRVISALGLENKSPTTRQRVLFVFHSAPLAPTTPASQSDSSAEPNQK